MKINSEGEVVATYKSISECARDCNSTPSRIFAHIQWHTPLDGFYFHADVPPLDKDRRNGRRRELYAKRPSKPKPPKQHDRHAQAPPRPEPPRHAQARSPLGRWLALVPEEFREGCETVARRHMATGRSAKEAFAIWYVNQEDCLISSDLIVQTSKDGTDE